MSGPSAPYLGDLCSCGQRATGVVFSPTWGRIPHCGRSGRRVDEATSLCAGQKQAR